jgi:hypothetical protein
MQEIVIKIDENVYTRLFDNGTDFYEIDDILAMARAIRKGTVLPKGHGDLKDEDEIIKAIENRVEFLKKNDAVFMRLRKDIDILGCIPKIRCEVSTIIEADKENNDEDSN